MYTLEITGGALYSNSFLLARKVYNSGFVPDVVLGVWRGGSVPAICILEFFSAKKIEIEDMVVQAQSYSEIGVRNECELINYECLQHITRGFRVLIVDDVFESGITMKTIIENIKTTDNIKIATLFYKPHANLTDFEPDFYIFKTNKWVVFPHEKVIFQDQT